MPRTYLPTGPHDTLGTRRPQAFRLCDPAGCAMAPCPVRLDKMIGEGEGPHAMSWLFARGDTVRLCRTPSGAYYRLLRGSVRYGRPTRHGRLVVEPWS